MPFAQSRQNPTSSFRKKLTYLAALSATALLLSACSPADNEYSVAQSKTVAPSPAGAPAMDSVVSKPEAQRRRSNNISAEVQELSRQAAPAPAAASPAQDAPAATAAPQRFLAVRHELQIEAPAADLAGLWGAVKERCEQLDCQVEASALQRETSHSAGGAYLTMRVNPRDFAMLTSAIGGNAKVLNHQTSSEDKTGEVIDVEAQIKNRSEYRDSLRELLREKDVKRKLTDLMEIRDTLSQVQAEIDAAQAQRKVLEKDTGKQFVHMQFQPQQVVLSGTYNPWLQTWERAWNAMAGSAQSMVIATAALLPVLVVLGVLGVICVFVFKGVRRSRKSATATATATA
ncbi:DUF4349 domain-containing protein [Diaphorobacter sp. HDW4A]|uniref:DUF4349 domain-containing protein n=1 Tax=Diaphorobacter sp. HDW4A TaxID=2714924 RepID=UPI001409AEA6|nr:DUF4349 domain-containing protein [Diaphorobacter sp. HDW4A]QIL81056.1 DUF4349 domain-containing protein [Diaphorobacter sp. HDW4A]